MRYDITLRVYGKVTMQNPVGQGNYGNVQGVKEREFPAFPSESGLTDVEGVYSTRTEGQKIADAILKAKAECDCGEIKHPSVFPISIKAVKEDVPWDIKITRSNLTEPSEYEDRELHFDADEYTKMYLSQCLRKHYPDMKDDILDMVYFQNYIDGELNTVVHAYAKELNTFSMRRYFITLDEEDMQKLDKAIEKGEKDFRKDIKIHGVRRGNDEFPLG